MLANRPLHPMEQQNTSMRPSEPGLAPQSLPCAAALPRERRQRAYIPPPSAKQKTVFG
jgi:hypothetical protein